MSYSIDVAAAKALAQRPTKDRSIKPVSLTLPIQRESPLVWKTQKLK